MLTKLPQSTDRVLGYEASGTITTDEFSIFVDEFEAAIARHGKVGLLVHLPELPSLSPGVMWDDLKLIRYRNNLERYAIVSDSSILEWTSKVADALSSGDVRLFDTAHYDEAWRWVQQVDNNE